MCCQILWIINRTTFWIPKNIYIYTHVWVYLHIGNVDTLMTIELLGWGFLNPYILNGQPSPNPPIRSSSGLELNPASPNIPTRPGNKKKEAVSIRWGDGITELGYIFDEKTNPENSTNTLIQCQFDAGNIVSIGPRPCFKTKRRLHSSYSNQISDKYKYISTNIYIYTKHILGRSIGNNMYKYLYGKKKRIYI